MGLNGRSRKPMVYNIHMRIHIWMEQIKIPPKMFFIAALKKLQHFFIKLKIEALPGVLGNRGERALFQGNKGQILRETKTILGNMRKQSFDFCGTGEQAYFFRGTREQIPPPPPWDCLTKDLFLFETNIMP